MTEFLVYQKPIDRQYLSCSEIYGPIHGSAAVFLPIFAVNCHDNSTHDIDYVE